MAMQTTTTTPLFSAALRPDRSLRAAGGWLALGAAAALVTPLVVAVPEFAVPALAGFVLTAAGLVILGMRQARNQRITQQVTLWPEQLEITTVDAKGERMLCRFDPKVVRLVLDRDMNEKTRALTLRSGTESFEIGAFLSPGDKASFAKEFGRALHRARQ
ncbi:DUF2244 domain-containing protein [Devosia sp.]|uniref:DUF2244 domain-containing protein n=1 Tax=Devosia sp. TaxID=1871048 RepID=UPI002FCB145F